MAGTAGFTPDDLILTILRGQPPAAGALAGVDPVGFCELARSEGVLPLVADALARVDGAPAALSTALQTHARRLSALDLIQERELATLLAALDGASAGALLIKGAHLAFTRYRRPDLRSRIDTDLMIPSERVETARKILTDLGYEHTGHMDAPLVISQAGYVKRLGPTVVHTVDLHWKFANPYVFAGVASYEELAAGARSVPRLGPAARGPNDAHALLLACVHRVAHHFDSGRLIWLYDIFLLAGVLDMAEWAEFVELAIDRGVASICLLSLMQAKERLGAAVPGSVVARLETRAAEMDEVTAAYLQPSSRARQDVHVLATDLRSLPTWSDRLRLLRDHAFPSASYMRGVYAPFSRAPLSVLYARRALRGARRWLARP